MEAILNQETTYATDVKIFKFIYSSFVMLIELQLEQKGNFESKFP